MDVVNQVQQPDQSSRPGLWWIGWVGEDTLDLGDLSRQALSVETSRLQVRTVEVDVHVVPWRGLGMAATVSVGPGGAGGHVLAVRGSASILERESA